MKEDKLTKQDGGFDTKKYYISPQIKTHLIELSHPLLESSMTKRVKDGEVKEQWEEVVSDKEEFNFTW